MGVGQPDGLVVDGFACDQGPGDGVTFPDSLLVGAIPAVMAVALESPDGILTRQALGPYPGLGDIDRSHLVGAISGGKLGSGIAWSSQDGYKVPETNFCAPGLEHD